MISAYDAALFGDEIVLLPALSKVGLIRAVISDKTVFCRQCALIVPQNARDVTL